MDNKIKTIDLKCNAQFEVIKTKHAPIIDMYVTEVIDNDVFKLEYIQKERDPYSPNELICVNDAIYIRNNDNKGTSYVLPCWGFNCKVDFIKEEASFCIPVIVYNRLSSEKINVNFRFLASTKGIKEIIVYKQLLDKYNKEKIIIEQAAIEKREQAEKIMSILRS